MKNTTESGNTKSASEDELDLTPERAAELKTQGLVTSLVGAGVEEDKLTEIHETYSEQDAARTQNLESAYEVVTTPEDTSEED